MAQQYGQWPLNICQYVPMEAGDATMAKATGIWRGPFGSYKNDRKTETAEEDIGTFSRQALEFVTWNGITIPFPTGALNSTQFPIVAQASMGKVTATGTGPYVRPFVAAVADTPPALQYYGLRIGNKRAAADVALIKFALCQEWELSGKQGELWKLSSTWTAPRAETGPLSTGVALAAFDPFVFAKSLFYIDDSGGTIGTTQKTGILLAASIKWKTNVEWVPVGDGLLYPTAYKVGQPEITFSLTYELEQDGANSQVALARARYEANNFGLFRLTLPSNGGAEMQIDWAGRYDGVSEYAKEGDTDTSVTFTGKAQYSPVDSLWFGVKHTSSMATIP